MAFIRAHGAGATFTVEAGDYIVAFVIGRGTYGAGSSTCVWDQPGLNETLTLKQFITSVGGINVVAGVHAGTLTPGTHDFTFESQASNDRIYVLAVQGIDLANPLPDSDGDDGPLGNNTDDYVTLTLDTVVPGLLIACYHTDDDATANHTLTAGDGAFLVEDWQSSGVSQTSIVTHTADDLSATIRCNTTNLAQVMVAVSLRVGGGRSPSWF